MTTGEAVASSYFPHHRRRRSNSSYLKASLEWSAKPSIWHIVHAQQKWEHYGLVCNCFEKMVGQNRRQVGVSSLKNGKGACQLFVGHYPHDFWNQTRLYPEPRALFPLCLQHDCNQHHFQWWWECWSQNDKFISKDRHCIATGGGADPNGVFQVIRTVFISDFHKELWQMYRRRLNKHFGCHLDSFVMLLYTVPQSKDFCLCCPINLVAGTLLEASRYRLLVERSYSLAS